MRWILFWGSEIFKHNFYNLTKDKGLNCKQYKVQKPLLPQQESQRTGGKKSWGWQNRCLWQLSGGGKGYIQLILFPQIPAHCHEGSMIIIYQLNRIYKSFNISIMARSPVQNHNINQKNIILFGRRKSSKYKVIQRVTDPYLEQL